MIYTAKYVLPITSEPIEDGAVLVRGDRIEAVGPELAQAYPDEPRRDLGETILLPGLVNSHSHLDYTILRGAIGALPFFPWVRKVAEYALGMQPEDFKYSCLLGAAELIQAGVTTVGDASFSGAAMGALLESGLRGVVFQEVFGYRGEDYFDELHALRVQVDALGEKATDRVRVGVSPHSIYTVSAGLLKAVRDLAYSEGLPLSIHVAESASEYEFCVSGSGEIADMYRVLGVEWSQPGVSPVQYLYDLGVLGERTLAAHCVHVRGNDIPLLAATRTGVAHCPKSNAKLGAGAAPVDDLLRAGARLGIGTDSAASSGTLDIWDETRLSLLLRDGTGGPGPLNAKSMVEAATIGGARSLAMEKEIGSIEPGKKADLTAVDISGAKSFPDDPYVMLACCASGKDTLLTMVDGIELYDDGELNTLDVGEVKRKAAAVDIGDR